MVKTAQMQEQTLYYDPDESAVTPPVTEDGTTDETEGEDEPTLTPEDKSLLGFGSAWRYDQLANGWFPYFVLSDTQEEYLVAIPGAEQKAASGSMLMAPAPAERPPVQIYPSGVNTVNLRLKTQNLKNH